MVLIDFLTVLLPLTVVFWVVAMVAAPTVITPLLLLDHDRGRRGTRRLIITGQVLQSVLFAAFIALSTVAYSGNRVANNWPYALCAFLSTYYVLSTHAYETGKPPTGLRAQVAHPAAVHEGALLGCILGLAAFVVLYLRPITVGVVAVSPLVALLVRVSGFWGIRVVLLFVAIAYIFKVGLVTLLTPVMLGSEIAQRLRGRRGTTETK